MNPRKAPKPFPVKIEKLLYGGAGLAREQGKVVFVPFSVPGDELLVSPFEEKKNYVRAAIARILKPGEGRREPECPYFQSCGGCHWQQLEYSRQVEEKRRILEELFHHKFPATRDIPATMQPCPQPYGYRSRARIQLRRSPETLSVGFFRGGSHLVEDVELCPLFRPSLSRALSALRERYSVTDNDPLPREMDIACSEEEEAWAAGVPDADSCEDNSARTGDGTKEVLLHRSIGEFVYSTSASVFFQANDFMVPVLAARVTALAASAGGDAALDLYSGVGLFSLPLARQFNEVTAVENSPSACMLCEANVSSAGLPRVETVCADVAEWMASQHAGTRRWDLVVLDPPRSGAGTAVMELLRKLAPRTIIYVSCDPQTLCRDLADISPADYRIDTVEGFDMFPQTYHFETVVRLIRNG